MKDASMGDESWYGASYAGAFDLEAEARGARGAECHVCGDRAVQLVKLSQAPDGNNLVELGSAVFLCGTCFELVVGGGRTELEHRFTESDGEEVAGVADRMVSGYVASAPVTRQD